MEKIKILITNELSSEGLEILHNSPQLSVNYQPHFLAAQLAQAVRDYDCMVIRSTTKLDSTLLAQARALKLIVCLGAGVDNVDCTYAAQKQILVMNTASANSLSAAEQTLGLLFALFRNIPQAHQSLQNQKWDRSLFKGHEICGKTLGVIGIGRIGKLVTQKALTLGMKVVGYDLIYSDTHQIEAAWASQNADFTLAQSQDQVLRKSDVVTLHIPLNERNQNLIGWPQLVQFKKNAYLINCARGKIVDETALLKAINEGIIQGAALDVFCEEPPRFPNPLFSHPKIICVPHLGAATFEAQSRVATTAAQQIIQFFLNGTKEGVINL